MKRLTFLGPILLFLALGAAFAVGLTRDPSHIPSQLVDRPLPEFELPAIGEGYSGFSTQDFTGNVSLINIFGSWCISCHVEHDLLMAIARRGDVPIYGVDWKDKPGAGAAWLERFGNPYYRVGDDRNGRVAIDLGVTGAPETFVVDKEGRVRYKHVGPITTYDWENTLLPLIEELKRS